MSFWKERCKLQFRAGFIGYFMQVKREGLAFDRQAFLKELEEVMDEAVIEVDQWIRCGEKSVDKDQKDI